METKTICFKDLSTSLKVLVVFGWIIAGTYGIGFITGVIVGILEFI